MDYKENVTLIHCAHFSVSVHRQDFDKLRPAKVRYEGQVIWNFPAIFHTTCPVDVTYFPYDQQQCRLEYSSWTSLNLTFITEAIVELMISTMKMVNGILWRSRLKG